MKSKRFTRKQINLLNRLATLKKMGSMTRVEWDEHDRIAAYFSNFLPMERNKFSDWHPFDELISDDPPFSDEFDNLSWKGEIR